MTAPMHGDFHYYVQVQADFERVSSIDESSGKELAEILSIGLQQWGIYVANVEGIDSFHYLKCKTGESSIELMVGEEIPHLQGDLWFIEPVGKQKPKVSDERDCRALLLAVDHVLKQCGRISSIRWYPSFQEPAYLKLMPYSKRPVQEADYGKRIHPLLRFHQHVVRVNNLIWHPLGIIVSLLICFAISPVLSWSVGVVLSTVFGIKFALGFVVPIVLDVFVVREAKRIVDSDYESA